MLNVSASQQDIKKPRLTYLHASDRHADQDRNGIEKTITFFLTNIEHFQLYCKYAQINFLEGNRVSKALQNLLTQKPKLASKLAKNFNYGVCNCDT